MAVLECGNCGGKVQSNKCCKEPMRVRGENLECKNCGKEVEINFCCGKRMHEKKA